MKQITFYLDFISPYAYLAFERLPEMLRGLSYSVNYKPVLAGALFKHHGHSAPVEIPAKRSWLYRHVQWLAQQQGTPLQLPTVHPFAPLPLLRLALACDVNGLPNRYVCETVFRHVWSGGLDAVDAARLIALASTLHPTQDAAGNDVKAQLRLHTDEAIAAGVFGVPSFAVDGKVFWGLDALPMLRDYLQQGTWFAGPAWDAAANFPSGLS